MLAWRGARLTWSAVALAAVCAAAAAQGAISAAQQAATSADDSLLAKAGKMYYSTARAGLAGFDCQVHPDWHTLFESADAGTTVAPDDKRLVALSGVRIALHARMSGDSTMDWRPAADGGGDADSTALLGQMQQATERTLQGFLQFWRPFVNGSVVPADISGLTVTHSARGIALETSQTGTEVTEIFSSDLVLEEFDVVASGNEFKFEPAYKATAEGLLVNRFLAHVQKVGDTKGAVQEMRVGIEYQTIENFPIPSQLNMELVGTGIFNMALDGCTVTRQQQPAPESEPLPKK